MDDLVSWLSRCLDSLETNARAATGSQWETVWISRPGSDPEVGDVHYVFADEKEAVLDTEGGATLPRDVDAEHIAAHDPRAVLARVEAERQLVTAYTTPDLDPAVMADVLRHLAYGHRFDAPGYLEEWAPEGSAA